MTATAPGFGEATRTWARIALLSFGGPAAQIALMHRVLVEEKGWIDEQRFLHALNFCTLLPGPEAQQLATYVGWLFHGVRGGIVAGMLFILPGVVTIMALSWLYVLTGNVGIVAGLLFGLKAAVLAIVLHALGRIARRALVARWQRVLGLAAFLLLFFLSAPFPLVVFGAGLVGWWKVRTVARPAKAPAYRIGWGQSVRLAAPWLASWLLPVAALLLLLGPGHVLSQIATFFSGAAMVTFGGAYAVLAYVGQQAVENYHWLTAREMLDGLGLAETTPGPLIMVLQFVGFLAAYRDPGMLDPLLAGTIGGLAATFVTFAPCFLWIFAGAPHIEQLRDRPGLTGALSGVLAAVVGVIASLALWFAVHALFRSTLRIDWAPFAFDVPVIPSIDPWAAMLAFAAALAIFRFKLGIGATIAGAAAAGMLLTALGVAG
ncbi:MAG: chromate efflux transporter [Pseudomonadota bacterium]|nr:chromate efflux transporter [Pseudomonadota bacterium]